MNPKFAKATDNPVLGGALGTCFDVSVLAENGAFRMWFSWRDKKAIALVESKDGINWSRNPKIAISGGSRRRTCFWRPKRRDVSRPCVIFHRGLYHLWYSTHSRTIDIAYAISKDGVRWKERRKPVLSPELAWEKDALMGPCVIYDDREQIFKMWYSGGGQHEPDAVGYATSRDGIEWIKHQANPIFAADPSLSWERDRAIGLHVVKAAGYYVGFYIGFADGFEKACVGLARSADGITNWERYEGNPILLPGERGAWDDCNVYRPFVMCCGGSWMLWYNASRFSDRVEQIGLATSDRLELDELIWRRAAPASAIQTAGQKL